jgi:hypothetical protein
MRVHLQRLDAGRLLPNHSSVDDWPPYFYPGPSSPYVDSNDFDDFAALELHQYGAVRPDGDNHQTSNDDTFPGSDASGHTNGMAGLGLLIPDHAGFPTGRLDFSTGFPTLPIGLIDDLNNTEVRSVPLETSHCTVGETSLNIIRTIPRLAEPEPQSETRYYCKEEGCVVSTTRPGDLERHMRLHSTSPRKCKLCTREICNRPDKVKEHLKKYHRIDPVILPERPELWE